MHSFNTKQLTYCIHCDLPPTHTHLTLFITQGGETALMWASMNGHLEVAKLLIESGADVNIQNGVSV